MTRRTSQTGLLLATLLLLAVWGWAAVRLLRPVPPNAPGVLEVEPRELTFDFDPAGDPPPAVLTLRNIGGGPLRIGDITTTCGCTLAGRPGTALLTSGQSTTLRVQGRPAQIGSKRAAVTIAADGSSATVPVNLRGRQVQTPFATYVPQRLELRATRPEPMATEFTLRTVEAAGSPPWITAVQFDAAAGEVVRLDLSETPQPHGTLARAYRYRLTVPFLPTEGVAAGRIGFATRPATPALAQTVAVLASLVPAVRAVPESLLVRWDEADVGMTRDVLFLTETPDRRVTVTPQPPAVDWVVFEPFEPGLPGSTLAGRASVRLLPERVPDGVAEIRLTFQTDDLDQPSVDVSLRVESSAVVIVNP